MKLVDYIGRLLGRIAARVMRWPVFEPLWERAMAPTYRLLDEIEAEHQAEVERLRTALSGLDSACRGYMKYHAEKVYGSERVAREVYGLRGLYPALDVSARALNAAKEKT